MSQQVVVQGQNIIFPMPTNGQQYPVPLNECQDSHGILRWTKHMSEKTWVTSEMLRQFMVLAAAQASISLY